MENGQEPYLMNDILEVAVILAECDQLSFESLLASHGLKITGRYNTDQLDKSVQPEIIESMAYDITEVVLEYNDLTNIQQSLRSIAEDYGYITNVLEETPPGWKHTVEKMKKHMPEDLTLARDLVFARAWAMHKKGTNVTEGSEPAQKVYCSQCGNAFPPKRTPGGYSHCQDHAGVKQIRE